MTSFPPTALIFAENEEETAPEELASTMSRSISSTSLGEKFAEHINARSDYCRNSSVSASILGQGGSTLLF